MKLYKTYSDDDGHTYLIPKDEFDKFVEDLEDLENDVDCSSDYETEEQEDYYWNNVALRDDHFNKYERLEGEDYYVLLASDLGENI